MKKLLFVLAVFITFILWGLNAKGADRDQVKDAQYYHQMEARFVELIRDNLEARGYGNCGVTLTTIIPLDAGREYTIKIHHHLISDMDMDGKELLMAELEKISYPFDECSVKYELVD